MKSTRFVIGMLLVVVALGWGINQGLRADATMATAMGTTSATTAAPAAAPAPPAKAAAKPEPQRGQDRGQNGPTRQDPGSRGTGPQGQPAQMRGTTQAQRLAARMSQGRTAGGTNLRFAGIDPTTAALSPLAFRAPGAGARGPSALGAALNPLATMATAFSIPDYFGMPNWANSPLPQLDVTGAVIPGTGMRKFVDALPMLPIAVPDIVTFPGSDYYEISLVSYNGVMHTDLSAANGGLGTQLVGYVQTNKGTDASTCGAPPACTVANNTKVPAGVQYLGPLIVATKGRPVRVKFTNNLATGAAGNLFLPTDTTYMGAGLGPDGTPYSQNRGELHLHGGVTPWISDGTPHQWTTPVGETSTNYTKGLSVGYVPDMWFDASGNVIASCAGSLTCGVAGASNNPGAGRLTYYWTNQQSGRLMFYHDHAYGITRLNVYAGEAAGYLLADPAEENALATASVPGTLGTTPDLAHLIPLVIQDKTFVPDNGATGGQLANTDPTWPSPANPLPGGISWGKGNLWFPHVYMPNQNPMDPSGANGFGRWDYGPWFWPPQDPATLVAPPIPCPNNPTILCPGTPNPSGTPEAFMDTPVVNGKAYPTLTVDPAAYRFRILSVGNDRTLNLGLYVADPLSIALTTPGAGYTAAPAVTITPANGAVATAVVSPGAVTAAVVTGGGAGYTASPAVTFADTSVTVAAGAVAVINNQGQVTAVAVFAGGSGYTSATTVTIAAPGCTPGPGCAQATAIATVVPAGSLLGVALTTPPTNAFTGQPTVAIAAPGCTPGPGCVTATASASGVTEVRMVPAAPPGPTSPLQPCASLTPSGTAGAGETPITTRSLGIGLATSAIYNGTTNITGLPPNCWPVYSTDPGLPAPAMWPTDGRAGGVPDPTTAGPPFIQIGTEGGLLPSAVVIPSTPLGYEYNRRSITVLNIATHGLLLGPAERADVIVDFSQFAGKTLIVYNDAPAPVPAFDTRTDYYTGDPDQTATGGAPSTLPGYGPNTRTVMQIVVNPAVTTAGNVTPFTLASLQAALPGIYSGTALGGAAGSNQPNPVIPVGMTSTIQATSIATAPSPVSALTLEAAGSGYMSAPGVFIQGGGGGGATGTTTLAPRAVGSLAMGVGCGPGVPCTAAQLYTSAPSVSFALTSAGGTGAAATAALAAAGGVKSVSVTNGGKNYATAPTVVFTGGGGSLAAATATVVSGKITAIAVTNPGSGYTTAPSISFVGGGGSGGKASATLGRPVGSVTLTNGGSGYNSAPTVVFSGGGGSGASATAALAPGPVASVTLTAGGANYTQVPLVTLAGGGGTGALVDATLLNSYHMVPKTIQELFTLDLGRMNATLGVEVEFTNFVTQTTIPYGYVDPPTEVIQNGQPQVWKITHNGVDTHFIHFHLFNVQVVNRVGWDGAIKPPDANELGWKDTVRMNPLEDIIVAVNPIQPGLPFDLPNSIRPLDVTEPVGYSSGMSFTNVDPANNPATTVNDLTNFGWEYVWHCHILGHEENDMMRPILMAVPPVAPSNLAAPAAGTLTWIDNSLNETSFTIQQATSATGPWTNIATVAGVAGSNNTVTFKNASIIKNGFYYRVVATNLVGYTRTFAAPAVGYPWTSLDSPPSNVILH